MAGNIVTGSPISDVNPLYMAARAAFVVGGQGTPEREVCYAVAGTSVLLGVQHADCSTAQLHCQL